MSTAAKDEPSVPSVDLTREVCPITFVKAKLHMERMAPGELIEFVLKEGDQIRDVPRSLKEEGHRIEAVRQEGERYRLRVRKG